MMKMRKKKQYKSMRKFVWVAAVAVAVAACAENEKVEVSTPADVDVPVYFQTAPYTRLTEFEHTYIFESAAWYLEKGKTWEQNSEEGVKYIPESEISYMSNVWRSVHPYYWPKTGGSLSFYSWSLNKENLDFNKGSKATVTIDRDKGVLLDNFDITVDKGIDFLVAVPALNQTKNQDLYYTNGVPTLFKHKLSSLQITAATQDEYPGKTITVTGIKITGVAKEADYQEGEENGQGEWNVIDQWTVDPSAGTYDADFYDGSDGGTEVSTNTVTFGGEQTIYIPQDFTGDEMLEITYEIYDEVSGITETITVKIPLKEALKTASGTDDGKFEPGKEYTLNLKFSLELVTWDPAVDDWDDETKGVSVQE